MFGTKGSAMTPDKAKANSHLLLRERGIPINEHLPVIEAPESLKPKDAKAIARRSVVLNYVIGIAYGADVARLNSFLNESGLIEYASASEKALLCCIKHTEQEKMMLDGWPNVFRAWRGAWVLTIWIRSAAAMTISRPTSLDRSSIRPHLSRPLN